MYDKDIFDQCVKPLNQVAKGGDYVALEEKQPVEPPQQDEVAEFECQRAKFSKGKKYTGAYIGTLSPGKISEDVFTEQLGGGDLFAYLFRRFGYPNVGWDDYKELANYVISTPMEDVFLEICPYLGGPKTSLHFGYLVSTEIDAKLAQEMLKDRQKDTFAWKEWPTESYIYRCSKALQEAIRDLERPVFVRDIPINCKGRINDEQMDGLRKEADYSDHAGYGIPDKIIKRLMDEDA